MRFGSGFPGAAHIGQLRLDAFDIECDGAAAGQRQFHRAIRPFAILDEADGEKRKHLFLVVAVDAVRADSGDPLQENHAAAALRRQALFLSAFPDETVGGKRELPVFRLEGNVLQLEDAVLHMRRNDGEIFSIQRQQFQAAHRFLPSSAVRTAISMTYNGNRQSGATLQRVENG